MFRRTLGLPDLSTQENTVLDISTQPAQKTPLSSCARISKYITSMYIYPGQYNPCGSCIDNDEDDENKDDDPHAPEVRLPMLAELCCNLARTLRRLALSTTNPPNSHEVEAHGNVFMNLVMLEELISDCHLLFALRSPPPNLKRLAVADGRSSDLQNSSLFFSSLEQLVCMRPYDLSAQAIDHIFSAYHGEQLDVVFVHVDWCHRTPPGTRSWTPSDTVRIWEANCPESVDYMEYYYCQDYIWTTGARGTLWDNINNDWRRMASS